MLNINIITKLFIAIIIILSINLKIIKLIQISKKKCILNQVKFIFFILKLGRFTSSAYNLEISLN